MERWILEEFESMSLGDVRLNKRAQKILSNFSKHPHTSIPTAFYGWAETKAAYRFLENKKVNSEAILAPHKKNILKRVSKYNQILLIQDTTELNYSSQRQKSGVGPSNSDNGQKTLFLHPSIVVTPQQVCLGVYDDYQWYRQELSRHRGSLKQMNNERLHYKCINDKESYRWLLGYRHANEIATTCPKTQVIMVADRSGDIYDIYNEAEKTEKNRAYWLVRVKTENRAIMNDFGERDKKLLNKKMKKVEPCQIIEFDLPKRNGVPGRKVKQALRVARVTLHPPTGRRGKLRCIPVKATVLLAQEIDAPKNKKPITWWLMTNLELSKEVTAVDLIQYYLCRWQIEVFFRILKSGCQVERLQLTTFERTRSCLALYMIIAWRILFLTSMAKAEPNKNCSAVLEYKEWTTAYIIVKKNGPPKHPPTIDIAVKLIAQMGGYLARRHDPPPGPKAMWQGLTKLYDMLKFEENTRHLLTYG